MATLQWIRGLPAEDRNRLSEQALLYVKPPQNLELFSELSPESQARAARSIIHSFGYNAPEKAQKWIESLPAGRVRENAWYGYGVSQSVLADIPPGPERDAMLHGRSLGSGTREVETDLGVVLQIGDQTRRRDAFDQVMQMYLETFTNQTDRARKALEASAFPENWKQAWRAP